MELLEQCQIWAENGEYQKIIDALEAIPAEQRTAEMDSELARAYNNLADHTTPEGRELLKKAIALLEPHADYFKGNHCWNFRMAYAYYYLDQEGPALRYFEQALEARPGDEDTQELIDDCRRRLTLPRFGRPFRARVREAWAAFADIEGELRALMDADQTWERGEEIVAKCEGALNLALSSTAFEIGFNGEKYELILSADGIRHNLFPLVYFRTHAPKPVLEHWNIWVGRQPSADFSLRSGEDEVRPEDVQVWTEQQENGQVALAVYCEKLLPLQREDGERAWWLLSTLTDHVLGEINAIAHIGAFDLLDAPKKGPVPIPAVSLAELPQTLKNLGLTDYRDGGDYLEHSDLSYELEPNEDPDADWRADIFAGSTRLPALINDYMKAEGDIVDAYHADGVAAGFFVYPLDSFTGEDRAKQIVDFRDAFQEAVTEKAGEDAVTFLGGATGLYGGYLDFLAWDLMPVLQAAKTIFEDSSVAWAQFHVFRRDVGAWTWWRWRMSPRWTRRPAPSCRRRTSRPWSPSVGTQPAILGGCTATSWSSWRRGSAKGGSPGGRPGRICRLPCGTPMPATIWMNIPCTTGPPSGCPPPNKTPGAAACGTTATPAPLCTAGGWRRPSDMLSRG